MSKRPPSTGFWTTVVLAAALVGYPLSFGPACWMTSWFRCGERTITTVYHPIVWTRLNGPVIIDSAIDWYSQVGARKGWGWWVSFSNVGSGQMVELYWGGPD